MAYFHLMVQFNNTPKHTQNHTFTPSRAPGATSCLHHRLRGPERLQKQLLPRYRHLNMQTHQRSALTQHGLTAQRSALTQHGLTPLRPALTQHGLTPCVLLSPNTVWPPLHSALTQHGLTALRSALTQHGLTALQSTAVYCSLLGDMAQELRAVVWQSEGCWFDPTLGVSKCPWARQLTPDCSWRAGWYLAWQPIAVGEWGINCTALWIKALYKRSPFTG